MKILTEKQYGLKLKIDARSELLEKVMNDRYKLGC